MKGFKTLDDFDVSKKTVLLRIDINTTLDEKGVPQMSERIQAAGETLKELSKKGAKTVVMAHQGRAGDEDFASLQHHAKLLSESAGRKVKFIDDIFGPAARRAINELKGGDILLLENVRFLAEETLNRTPEQHAESFLVTKLSPLIDLFVNDAFSAAHRSQASLVGFAVKLPKALGRTMEREISSLSKAMENPEKPCLYVLGGLKPDEAFKVMAHGLERGSIDTAITGGVIGRIFLIAKGVDTGPKDQKFFAAKGFLNFVPKAKDLIARYGKKVMTPVDVAASKEGKRVNIDVPSLPTDLEIFDIGSKTIRAYTDLIMGAKTIVMNGPAGVYEDPQFSLGTKEIYAAMTKSKAFSLLGGGSTTDSIQKLGFTYDQFSYVSLAGGALISYLGGEPMPAIDAMRV